MAPDRTTDPSIRTTPMGFTYPSAIRSQNRLDARNCVHSFAAIAVIFLASTSSIDAAERNHQRPRSIASPNTVSSSVVPVAYSEPIFDGACDAIPTGQTQWKRQRLATGPSGSFWAKAEYLYWDRTGAEFPPLVTTSGSGTARVNAGTLGDFSSVIFGGSDELDGQESGGRYSIGFWWDDSQDLGVEFTYINLGDQDLSFTARSSEHAILARPFFNTDAGLEDARLLAFPNEVSGNIEINADSSFQLFDLAIRRNVSSRRGTPVYLLMGYRGGDFDESIRIADTSTSLAGATQGVSLSSTDAFQVENEFHGFRVGLANEMSLRGLPLNAIPLFRGLVLAVDGSVSVGQTNRQIMISGQSVTNNGLGQSTTSNGGLLTQPTNIGQYDSDSFGTLHDVSLKLTKRIGRNLSANLGYSLYGWSNVGRAAEQIDRRVNPTQVGGGTLSGLQRPAFNEATNDFVAHGITFGASMTW